MFQISSDLVIKFIITGFIYGESLGTLMQQLSVIQLKERARLCVFSSAGRSPSFFTVSFSLISSLFLLSVD